MIGYIRMFISAYIKENRLIYENFIEENLDEFCTREVESWNRECDQVNLFSY
jgi:hypothetical protein